jgi:hypothetical protein
MLLKPVGNWNLRFVPSGQNLAVVPIVHHSFIKKEVSVDVDSSTVRVYEAPKAPLANT